MNDRLKNLLKTLAYAGIAGASFFGVLYVATAVTTKKTVKIVKELNEYKATLPDYNDSLRVFDETEGRQMIDMANKLDSVNMGKLKMPKSKVLALQNDLQAKLARHNRLVVNRSIVQHNLKLHLDSVRMANKGKLFIVEDALRYNGK